MGSASAIERLRRRLGPSSGTRSTLRAIGDRLTAVEAADRDLDDAMKRLRRRHKVVGDRTRAELTRISQDLGSQKGELKSLSVKLDEVRRQMEPYAEASDLRALEHNRLSFQFGAIEERIGRLEQRVMDGVFVGDTEETAEARSLVEAVRREHEQIRVRMQIITAYEERLRRVEETASALYDGDPRHPV